MSGTDLEEREKGSRANDDADDQQLYRDEQDDLNEAQDDTAPAKDKDKDDGSGLDEKDGRFLKRHKKKIVGGGIIGTILFGMGLGFLGLNSLKPLGLRNVIDRKAFASSEQMSGRATEKLYSGWVAKKLLPGMIQGQCTSTKVNRSCVLPSDASTPMGQLFNAWRDARLEKIMADRYGLEIIRDGRNFSIKANWLGEPLPLPDDVMTSDNDWLEGLSNYEARHQIRLELRAATKWQQVFFRYRVASLLERKYGIRRCIVQCEKRDARKESREIKKQARKAWFVERFVFPRNAGAALVLDCMLSSFDCAKTSEVNPEGSRLSPFETELHAKLLEIHNGGLGQSTLDELGKKAEDLRTNGFGFYLIKKLTNETIAKVLTKAIPIIGQVEAAVQFVNTLREAGPALRTIVFAMNSAYAVSMYAFLATGTDEAIAGKSDAELVGQLNGMFDSNPNGENGTAEAFQDRLVQRYTNAEGTSRFASMFAPKASAKELPTNLCNDSKSEAGNGACPEYDLGGGNWLLSLGDSASSITNAIFGNQGSAPILDALGKLIALQDSFLGWVIGAAIPDPILKFIATAAKPVEQLMLFAFESAIPRLGSNDPDKMSGGRNGAVAAIGAEKADTDAAMDGMGGYNLTRTEYSAILQDHDAQQNYAFEHSSLWSRVANVNEPRSLISQLVMVTPTSSGGLASSLSNFSSFFSVGSLVSGFFSKPVSAQTYTDLPPYDIMGLTKKGLRQNDPIYASIYKDPIAAWNTYNCSDPQVHIDWGNSKVQNPKTGEWEATTPDYCKLLESIRCTGGAWFNADLCSKNDLLGASADGSTAPTTGPTAGDCTGKTAAALAQEIKDNPNINLNAYDPATVNADINNTIAGKPGVRGVPVDINVLCALAIMGRTHKFSVNEIQGGTHSDGSFHYTGDAADLDNIDGSADAPPFSAAAKKFISELANVLPEFSGIGQSQCGNYPTLPPRINSFEDSCNHLHFQVPRD